MRLPVCSSFTSPVLSTMLAVTLAAGLSLIGPPADAEAMCSCMIRRPRPNPMPEEGGAELVLRSDASMVVAMREGRRTVLTMQNDYQGPPEDFALIVPVPEVLDEDQVRTLPHGLIERLDRLSAPKLVEYWEQNPCGGTQLAGRRRPRGARTAGAGSADGLAMAEAAAPAPPPVVVEREFSVNEYDIVILSAADSSGLERWLTREGWELPPGASAVFRPYVEQGTKFFLAKVNAGRVRFEGGRARLSPLQFHYDSDTFGLPIRLGLLNSPGTQDLVIHVLSHGQRFEVANKPNVVLPTNLEVVADAKDDFPQVYEALFERIRSHNPGAVITEYAADVGDDIGERDMRRLGADVMASRNPRGFTLTRLHYRYTRDTIGDDLVFRTAPPIGGGEGMPAPDGTLGARTAISRPVNSFHGRFAVVHRWERPVSCTNPRRGRWRRPVGTPARRNLEGSLSPVAAFDDERLDDVVLGGLRDVGLGPQVTGSGVNDEDKERMLAQMGQALDTATPTATSPKPELPTAAAAADDGLFSCGVAGRSSRARLWLGLFLLPLLRVFRRRDR